MIDFDQMSKSKAMKKIKKVLMQERGMDLLGRRQRMLRTKRQS